MLLLFVHIPKTGGTSIARSLKISLRTGQHDSALKLRDYMPAEDWNSKYKFTIIRNPWDFVVSWYHWHRYNEKYDSFEEWIKKGLPVEPKPWFLEGAPNNPLDQENYFCDQDGAILVDYVGRFESLGQSFEHVKKTTGKVPGTTKLLHVQQTRGPRPHYKTFYNQETQQIVGDRFKDFCERFEYKY